MRNFQNSYSVKNKIFVLKYFIRNYILSLLQRFFIMKVKGNLIREARRRKDFSQDYMANLLDISQSQYSKLENGEANFDVSKLGALLDALELNPLEVIEFSEKQQIFINSNNTIVNNAGEIKSPLITNDVNFIRQIIQEELQKLQK